MRRIALVAVLGAALVLAGAAASASRKTVRATLAGTCTTKNRLDHNGVLVSSTVTCKTNVACKCDGPMRLVYQSRWTSPGTGAPGPEKGTLVATGKSGTVRLQLTGKRAGTGQSSGRWVLRKASGPAKAGLRTRGTYTTVTKTRGSVTATTAPARVSITISCWHC